MTLLLQLDVLSALLQKTIVETAKRLAEEDAQGQSLEKLKASEKELTGLFGNLLDQMRPDIDSVERADADRIKKVSVCQHRNPTTHLLTSSAGSCRHCSLVFDISLPSSAGGIRAVHIFRDGDAAGRASGADQRRAADPRRHPGARQPADLAGGGLRNCGGRHQTHVRCVTCCSSLRCIPMPSDMELTATSSHAILWPLNRSSRHCSRTTTTVLCSHSLAPSPSPGRRRRLCHVVCCPAGGKYELLMVDDGELVLAEQDGNVQLNSVPKVAFQVRRVAASHRAVRCVAG